MKGKFLLTVFFYAITLSAFCQLKKITLNGAEFHYVDTGKGEPIVFVHGGLEDYTTWLPQIERFSKKYRVIAYSRRYNYPNQNKQQSQAFSPLDEAADLQSLIKSLKLNKVHLVGHSYGGLIALHVALKSPNTLQTLTLSEPANFDWLPTLDGGEKLLQNFNDALWQNVRVSFNSKDSLAVLSYTFKYFSGEDLVDKLPPEAISQLKQSLGEWHALAFSPKAFSGVEKESLSKISVPVFILTGGQTFPILKPLNKELLRLLPKSKHYFFEEGTHDYWMTHPDVVGEQLLTFIDSVRSK